ncbi:MAG: PKD domain-containing protein, partial [Kiritimatiellae bacterium]|nr:PKD domain-containing protein [Kiritimatiellia bacterium]
PDKVPLYLGHTEGPPSNGRTNWITKGVIVLPAPDPTVKVALVGADANSGILTVPESDDVAQTLRVTLSKPAETNMWVTLTADPSYIKLSADKVLISGGNSESDAVNFWAINNTPAVSITPTIPGDTVYVITKPGTVKIENIAPVIIEPTEDQRNVITLDELEVNYSISDVEADAELITTWDWGDMTTPTVTTGAVGTVKHVYNALGVYNVKVRSRDPDNTYSLTRTFPVNVTAGTPKPTIRVICDTSKLTESPSNILSYVTVQLSEPYPKGELKYKLIVDQADSDTSITNLLMTHAENGTELTIEAGQTVGTVQSPFRIMDGTMNTESAGVRITAVPTDPIAANFYASVSKLIMFQNTPPLIAAPTMYQYTEEYPATVPRQYYYNFKDHSADLDSIVSVWNFGDGSAPITVVGASGSVTHTYDKQGVYNLSILVRDKDEIAANAYKEEEIFVVNIGDEPCIEILPAEQQLMEYSTKGAQIQVQLSAPFEYAVPVTLTVSPGNSNANGRLFLGAEEAGGTSYTIEFRAGQTVQTVKILDDLDGTARANASGFIITPSITPGQGTTANAAARFKKFIPGLVRIQNEDPIISAPRASTSAQDIVYELSQGIEKAFAYSIKYCQADSSVTGMTVTWNWGDGSAPEDTQGASGSAKHTYGSFGVYEIVMVARDKDGGYDERRFYVSVSAAQTLWVTPVGPNRASKYYGLTYEGVPLGSGKVLSSDAVSTRYENDIWRFVYNSTAPFASLEAVPDKAAEEGEYDSFFYAWDDFGAGLIAADLLSPMKSDPVCVVPFAASSTGGVYQVRAIFSREYRPLDNKGDLNQDGVPDDYQNPITGTTLK